MVVGGGLVAVPGPGPGWLIILLGLVMIAGESLSFARFADRAEIKLRRLARRVAAVWAASPASAKVLMMLALTFCATARGMGSIALSSVARIATDQLKAVVPRFFE